MAYVKTMQMKGYQKVMIAFWIQLIKEWNNVFLSRMQDRTHVYRK